MTHRVVITPAALEDLRNLASDLARETDRVGLAWLERLIEHIFTLETFPARCPIAPAESHELGTEVRCLLFGRRPHVRRILFTIDGAAVRVHQVMHGARDR